MNRERDYENKRIAKVLFRASLYFCIPYEDDPNDYIEGYGIRVYRPNHGLIHSAIQYFLAGDIIYFLNIPWSNDNKIKIEITACFQRSGRQQEGSSQNLKQIYEEYEEQDLLNFDYEARKFGFEDKSRRLFRESIRWSTKSKLPYSSLVRNIIHSSHLLHLRRMPKFDMERIKREVGEKLSSYFNKRDLAYVIEELWYIVGEYLRVTGDRDGNIGKNYYSKNFFLLSNNPTLLAKTLNNLKLYNNLYISH